MITKTEHCQIAEEENSGTKTTYRHMTEDEKVDTFVAACRLLDEGEENKAHVLIASVPLDPDMAQIFKEVYGPDFLVEYKYNLIEADEKYGKDWLYK